jgi:hypothetical protein
MLDNSSEPAISKNEELITQIYKNHIFSPDLIKDEDTTNNQESHNISCNFFNGEPKLIQFDKLKNENKTISKSSIKKTINQTPSKNKKVIFNNPFISVVLVESYKDCNLKMTYKEYEQNNNETVLNKNTCCKKKFCLLF